MIYAAFALMYHRAHQWAAKWWPIVVAAIVAVVTLGMVRRERAAPVLPDWPSLDAPAWDRARERAHVTEALRTSLIAKADAAAQRSIAAGDAAADVHDARLKERARISALSAAELSNELRRLASARRHRADRTGVRSAVLFLVLSVAVSARADAYPLAGKLGEPGWWISDMELRDLTADSSSYQLAIDEADKLTAALAQCRDEAATVRQAEALTRVDKAEATARAISAEARLSDAQHKLDAWWRRPRFLLGVGAAIGAGLVTALAIGVH